MVKHSGNCDVEVWPQLDLEYIASLIRTGGWFDGAKPFLPVNRTATPASVYAPPFFLDQAERFSYLLDREAG